MEDGNSERRSLRSTSAVWPLAALTLSALLAVSGAGCIEKTGVADDDDTTADACDETESLLTPFMVEGQAWCGREMPGDTTCFDCHLCAESDEALVDKQHYVCSFCHSGPAGEINEEHASGCGCEGLTCEDPTAPLTCSECHTDGCNGHVSAQVQRDSCLYCHTGTGEPPDA